MKHTIKFYFGLDLPEGMEHDYITKEVQCNIAQSWRIYSDFDALTDSWPSLVEPLEFNGLAIDGFLTDIESDVVMPGTCNTRSDCLIVSIHLDALFFSNKYSIDMKILKALVNLIAEQAKAQYHNLIDLHMSKIIVNHNEPKIKALF